MKKTMSFIVKIGQVLAIYTLMIITAIFAYSYFNKGYPIYGNRCKVAEIKNIEDVISFKELNQVTYRQECNTLYLYLDSDLSYEEYLAIIVRYYEVFKDIDYQGNIQIVASSSQMDKKIFASITSKGVSIN